MLDSADSVGMSGSRTAGRVEAIRSMAAGGATEAGRAPDSLDIVACLLSPEPMFRNAKPLVKHGLSPRAPLERLPLYGPICALPWRLSPGSRRPSGLIGRAAIPQSGLRESQ